MTLDDALKIVEQFWHLPKVESSAAQIPYFYDRAQLERLNEATTVLLEHNLALQDGKWVRS
jgi:hypothetical protein